MTDLTSLAAREYLVETNEGTFGDHEAARTVGTADPRFCVRRVYETVDGAVRVTGPDLARAPGRMRRINRAQLAADRAQLAALSRNA